MDLLNQSTKEKHFVINYRFTKWLICNQHASPSQHDPLWSTQTSASLNRRETDTWEEMRECSLWIPAYCSLHVSFFLQTEFSQLVSWG